MLVENADDTGGIVVTWCGRTSRKCGRANAPRCSMTQSMAKKLNDAEPMGPTLLRRLHSRPARATSTDTLFAYAPNALTNLAPSVRRSVAIGWKVAFCATKRQRNGSVTAT